MGLVNVADSDVISVHRLSLNNNPASRPDGVVPVIVKLRNKEIAKSIFKAKPKLAKSGIFLCENLTRKKRDILNAARDKFGNKCVWSDQGRIFVRETSDSSPRRLWSLEEIF